MPPSPSLSMRIAIDTYLMLVTITSVQTSSDSTPSVVPRSTWSPVAASTVFIV